MNTPHAPAFSRRTVLKTAGLGALALAARPTLLAREESSTPARASSAAPAAALPFPGTHKFSVGAFECITLNDGVAPMPRKPMWAPEGTDAEVEAALARWYLDTTTLRTAFNPLVIRTGKETLLVDAGMGAGARPALGNTLLQLGAAGVKPEEITTVFLSHAHGDHFGGLIADGKKVFPQARHVTSAAELKFWRDQPDFSASRLNDENKTNMLKSAQTALDILQPEGVAEGAAIADGISELPLYGHTGGHAGLRLASDGQELLYLADLAHHPVLMFENPAWTVDFDVNPPMAAATRQRVFAEASAKRSRVFLFHMPFPALGHIRADGARYEWVPEMWTV